MKRKVVGVLLSTVVAVSLLAGCGNGNGSDNNVSNSTGNDAGAREESGGQEAAGNSGEVETISVYYMNMGTASEYQNVEDAINAISIPEIGVEVNLTILDIGQWFEQYNMLISGGESVDLLPYFTDTLAAAVSQGSYRDLTELVEAYGQDIKEYVSDAYMDNCRYGEGLYGIPSINLYVHGQGIAYDVAIVKELGLEEQVSNVKTEEDWEPIMEAVKNAYPDITPHVEAGGNIVPTMIILGLDGCGNNYGFLDLRTDSTTLFNLFETDEFYELCKRKESWYEKGYIAPDVLTESDNFETLCKNGKAFSNVGLYNLTSQENMSTAVGKEMAYAQIGDGTRYFMSGAVAASWGIPTTASHPEAAMKFLNLAYSNPEVMTLLAYGEEGVNYQTLEDGTIDYLDGEDVLNCSYHPNITWLLPNQYIAKRWNGVADVTIEEVEEYNNNSKKSMALGFTFDTSKVVNEITACDNVSAQYLAALVSGGVNVDEELPRFIEALKDAGIDTIIAEKQSQLDQWLASNQ